jgi:fatty-acyl-CoA synthase
MSLATATDYLARNLAGDDGAPFLHLVAADGSSQSWTYTQLLARAAAWARGYQARGLVAGDRVVIILQHSPDLYAAFVGALLGGWVPAMFAFPSPKLSEQDYFRTVASLVDNADPRLVVVYPELKVKLVAALTGGTRRAAVVEPDEMTADPGRFDPRPTPDPQAVAFLQYSSGTTGLKKGVAVSHAALVWQIEHYARAIALGNADVIASWLPLYHDMGLIACLLLPLLKRVPLVAMSPFDWVRRPALLAQAITRFRASLVWMPNFAFQVMARNVPDEELARLDLSSLRAVVNCAEPVMAASFDEFLTRFASCGARAEALCASYAMAENTFAVTSGGFGEALPRDRVQLAAFAGGRALPADAADPANKLLVSSGRALPGIEVTVLSADGQPLPDRQVGEIAVASPCLFAGYFGNPEASARLLGHGRYLTGDLGYLADGHLYVTGRKKDLIIIGGQNIYPQDIEAIVNDVPGVVPGRCVALGVPDDAAGTETLVVLAESQCLDPPRQQALREQIQREVARRSEVAARDVRVVPHLWLRKSSSGKLSRNANRDRYLSELLPADAPPVAAPPAAVDDGLDARVRDCVRRVLVKARGGAQARLDDAAPLFSSGLIDSLSTAELLTLLERDTGLALPTDVEVGRPGFDSVADLAAALRRCRTAPRAHGAGANGDGPGDPPGALDLEDIPLTSEARAAAAARPAGFWTWYYRGLFRLKGVRCGKRLRVLGPISLRLDGHAHNIQLGDDVTLMPFVDLKNRGNGKIVLHDGVFLDTSVRLVAANDARLELGDEVQIAMGTIVNAGADVVIGRRTLIAPYCVIIASEHRASKVGPIVAQGYEHSPVYIGEDAWLAAQVFVGRGSRIGNGALIGAKSSVTGQVPANAVWVGHPGRVIRYRSS